MFTVLAGNHNGVASAVESYLNKNLDSEALVTMDSTDNFVSAIYRLDKVGESTFKDVYREIVKRFKPKTKDIDIDKVGNQAMLYLEW